MAGRGRGETMAGPGVGTGALMILLLMMMVGAKRRRGDTDGDKGPEDQGKDSTEVRSNFTPINPSNPSSRSPCPTLLVHTSTFSVPQTPFSPCLISLYLAPLNLVEE